MRNPNGHGALVQRAIRRASFCTLATSSARNRPHVVGVLYAEVDGALYVASLDGSKKVRNVRENPHVAVCIPVRKFPIGPPFCVQFEGMAAVVSPQDPEIVELVAAGHLKRILAHGELAEPRICFIRVTPARRVATFGLGVPLLALLRDPLRGSRTVELS